MDVRLPTGSTQKAAPPHKKLFEPSKPPSPQPVPNISVICFWSYFNHALPDSEERAALIKR